MSNRTIVILSSVFFGLIVLAVGGRLVWVAYQSSVEADPQTHFALAAEAMEAYDPNRLSILIDTYPDLPRTHSDEDGGTLLHLAMINGGDVALATMLIDRGADVNGKDALGHTPLHALVLCTEDGTTVSADVVAVLIENGADVNATDNQGKTPLALIPPEHEVYSDTFPEYFTTALKENRKLLISYGAEE